MTLRLNNNSPKQEIVRATLDAIAKHGFYLTHAAIEAELSRSLHNMTSSVIQPEPAGDRHACRRAASTRRFARP
jgi:hypothetical protein